MGGWVCLVFPRFWEMCRYPLRGEGVRFFGWVGGSLSLVDHQRCSWAEARCACIFLWQALFGHEKILVPSG